jgi:hypothetical protein
MNSSSSKSASPMCIDNVCCLLTAEKTTSYEVRALIASLVAIHAEHFVE